MDDWLHHVDRAREGDRDAFGELVEASWSALVAFARALTAGHADAEDAVQEALQTAWNHLPRLRDPRAFPAWVRTIVYRRCLARLRTAGRLSLVPLREDHRVAPNQVTGDVDRALAALSPRQRAVIYLGEIEGHSDPEIADLLGLRRPTVRIHRARARARLERLFGEERS